MANELDDIVSITITSESATVTQAGFGVPIILSANASFAERIRYYTTLAGMVTDSFTSTTPEYLAAAAMFAQNPRPERVAVGRLANKPTQRFAWTPVVANSTAYKLKVNGTLVSVTSDSDATATEIIGLMKTAIDALSLGITTSDQTTYLRILANTAGAFFSVEAVDVSLGTLVQDHADPGASADLDAIQLVDNTWYGICNLYNSAAMVAAVAGWAESNKKLFVAQSQDGDIIGSGTGDIATTLKTSARNRTAVIYHPKTDAFADAAWLGKCLPMDPGSETWKFKTLAGVPAVTLTSTHKTNLRNKKANFYYSVGGINMTSEGTTEGTTGQNFIDAVRGTDWLEARIQEGVVDGVANAKKIPYTDAGVAVIQGIVLGKLREGVSVGLLADDPAPAVTVPKVSTVSSANKSARLLPDVKFTATFAGALHKITISGNISI